jgi:signal peptidase
VSAVNERTALAESNDSASTAVAVRVLKVAAALVLVPAVAFVAFAVLGPMVLPYQAKVVRSGSMRPTIPVGALAVYRPVSSTDLRVGDVIAFTRPGGTGEVVTHRIFKIEQDGGKREFVTKGDANSAPDDWRVPATGTGWRYRFSIPAAGYALVALASTFGKVGVLGMAVAAVAFVLLVQLWRPTQASQALVADTDTAGPASLSEPASTAADGTSPFGDPARWLLAESATVILGHTDLLLRELAAADPLRHDVEAIRRAGQRVASLARASVSDSPLPSAALIGRTDSRPLAPPAAAGTRRLRTRASA